MLPAKGASLYKSALISRSGNSNRDVPAQHQGLYPVEWESLPTYIVPCSTAESKSVMDAYIKKKKKRFDEAC